MAEYRIVRDNYAGYEVQARRWWFPFWVQCDFSNTHTTIERAEEWAAAHAQRHAQKEVKRLGRFVTNAVVKAAAEKNEP
jgi:hypothetical protein